MYVREQYRYQVEGGDPFWPSGDPDWNWATTIWLLWKRSNFHGNEMSQSLPNSKLSWIKCEHFTRSTGICLWRGPTAIRNCRNGSFGSEPTTAITLMEAAHITLMVGIGRIEPCIDWKCMRTSNVRDSRSHSMKWWENSTTSVELTAIRMLKVVSRRASSPSDGSSTFDSCIVIRWMRPSTTTTCTAGRSSTCRKSTLRRWRNWTFRGRNWMWRRGRGHGTSPELGMTMATNSNL